MENTNISKGISIVENEITHTNEISTEFSLPDYIGEIRKLLVCKAQALPESRYVSDEKIELGGTLTYLLIYSDDEGVLCASPLNTPYEIEIPARLSGGTVFTSTEVDSVITKVNAPRKLTIKSRLKTRVTSIKNTPYEENISPKSSAEELFLERKTDDVPGFELLPCKLENIKISDKLEVGEGKAPKPIWCDATLWVDEVKAQNKSLLVKGVVLVKCVCQGEDGAIVELHKSLPFGEELECENSKAGDTARAQGRCVSLSISGDSTGEQLFFDIELELEGCVLKRQTTRITQDCYSTVCDSDVSYKDVELADVVKMGSYSFTVQEGVKRKNNEIKEIITEIAHPVWEKTEIKGNKMYLLGKVIVAVIGKSEAKENGVEEYLSESYEIPYKYELDTGRELSNYLVNAEVSCGKINTRYDGDKLQVSAELYPSLTIFEKTKVKAIDSATIHTDKKIEKNGSQVVVYFKKDSDTLWDIAKRYHTTMAGLKKENQIENDILPNSLIIG